MTAYIYFSFACRRCKTAMESTLQLINFTITA
jgi:hypothetical protein